MLDSQSTRGSSNIDAVVSFELNSIEIDTIGEILNISMGSAATAVSTLLGKR
jgi:chemotaxis protein CheY-P-specific phosphatase CheC